MSTYKSKVDAWLIVLIFAPAIYLLYTSLNSGEYGAVIILLLSVLFVAYLFLTIEYRITHTALNIKSGFIVDKNIAINEIKSVQKTNNMLSSPALSLDRLEIKYGNKFDFILISPVRKEEFVKELLSVNPDIQVTI